MVIDKYVRMWNIHSGSPLKLERMQYSCIRHMYAALQYFSRLQEMKDHRLCNVAFQADMRLGLGWFAGLKDALR